jgi:hypothetical protein
VIAANVRLTGLRGVGKTVLLQEFERLAREEAWATAQLELEPRDNNEADLVGSLAGACARTGERICRGARVRAQLGRAREALPSMSTALAALQKVEMPIAVVLCGLPTLTTNLLRTRTSTERMSAAKRLARSTHGPHTTLFVEPLRNTPITAEPSLVDDVLRAVEGVLYRLRKGQYEYTAPKFLRVPPAASASRG